MYTPYPTTEAAETAALAGKPSRPPPSSAAPTMSITATASGLASPGPQAPSAAEPTSPGGWSLGVVTEPLPEGPVGPLQGAPSLETMSYLNDSGAVGQGAWPASGTVQFVGVWMKYAPTAPYALRGVSFSIAHSEKVGPWLGAATSVVAWYN